MGGSYRQCTDCGKRALSIATRCPGCGRELPDPAHPEGAADWGLGRLLSPRVAAGILAAAAVLGAAKLDQTGLEPLDSVAGASEVAYVPAAATLPDSATTTALPAGSGGQLLVARTWASVRKARSRSASLEAVLMPGDTVLADSLGQGWYRVALEGEVLGYAHRSTLAVPGAAPDRSDRTRDARPSPGQGSL